MNFKKMFKKKIMQKKYKKINSHNKTWMANLFNINKVKVGNFTYGPIHVEEFNDQGEELEIGSFCSIAHGVKFLLGGEHKYSTISTYPFKRQILNLQEESFSKGKITIKDDVWIGYNTIILSGVTIGQGAIIGAGSVVTKDIPPYAIFAGNRIIKYRFSEKIIDKLIKINFNDLKQDNIERRIKYFYEKCTEDNVDEIIRKVTE